MSSVESLLKEFNKNGVDVAVFGHSVDSVKRLPSGIFQLDLASGGGFPMGRVSIIYGSEAAAKTTICLKVIAQAQRLFPDKKAVFVDVEGHFDGAWASKLGVQVDKLAYVIPQSAENTVDIVESVLYGDDLSVLVIDSLAAMTTTRELDSDAEKALVGAQGLLINKLYRKTSRALGMAKLQGKEPVVLMINQIRYKVGVMYGNPETMPGGPSFKYASSMTLKLWGKDEIDKDVNTTLPAWKEIKAKIEKQKIGIVAPNCEFKMAILPNKKKKLSVGETYEWNTVSHYLKSMGLLVKNKTKWDLVDPDTGEVTSYDAQWHIEVLFRDDKDLALRYKTLIFNNVLAGVHGDGLESEEEQEAAPDEPGSLVGEKTGWED